MSTIAPVGVTSEFSDVFSVTSYDLITAPTVSYGRYSYVASKSIMFFNLFGVVGTVTNVLTIIVIGSRKSMRKTYTNIFILNQCAIDLTTSVLVILMASLNVYIMTETEVDVYVCKLWLTTYPTMSTLISSTYNLVAMSIERYLATVSPIWHRVNVNPAHVYIAIGLVWLTGPAIVLYHIPTSVLKDGECRLYVSWPSEVAQQAVIIATSVLKLIVPVIIHIYCYARMAWVLLVKNKQTVNPLNATSQTTPAGIQRAEKLKRNLFQTLALVTLCFFMCWSSSEFFLLAYNFGLVPKEMYYNVSTYLAVPIFVNIFINPFVYIAKYQPFRQSFKLMFCRKKVNPMPESVPQNAAHTSRPGCLGNQAVTVRSNPLPTFVIEPSSPNEHI